MTRKKVKINRGGDQIALAFTLCNENLWKKMACLQKYNLNTIMQSIPTNLLIRKKKKKKVISLWMLL